MAAAPFPLIDIPINVQNAGFVVTPVTPGSAPVIPSSGFFVDPSGVIQQAPTDGTPSPTNLVPLPKIVPGDSTLENSLEDIAKDSTVVTEGATTTPTTQVGQAALAQAVIDAAPQIGGGIGEGQAGRGGDAPDGADGGLVGGGLEGADGPDGTDSGTGSTSGTSGTSGGTSSGVESSSGTESEGGFLGGIFGNSGLIGSPNVGPSGRAFGAALAIAGALTPLGIPLSLISFALAKEAEANKGTAKGQANIDAGALVSGFFGDAENEAGTNIEGSFLGKDAVGSIGNIGTGFGAAIGPGFAGPDGAQGGLIGPGDSGGNVGQVGAPDAAGFDTSADSDAAEAADADGPSSGAESGQAGGTEGADGPGPSAGGSIGSGFGGPGGAGAGTGGAGSGSGGVGGFGNI